MNGNRLLLVEAVRYHPDLIQAGDSDPAN